MVSSGETPRLIAAKVIEYARKQFVDGEDGEAGGAELYFEALKRRLDAEAPDYPT